MQMNCLSGEWTRMCFNLSLLFAKRLSQASKGHLKGFSPETKEDFKNEMIS